MNRVGLAVANGAAALLLALLAFFLPATAYADNGCGARGEFSDYELSRLFEETDDVTNCKFVMCDYSVYPTTITYLKVRSVYRARYDAFIGDDAVSLLSAREADSPDVVYPNRPLMQIGSTASEPWNDLLMLIGHYASKDYLGTAFMVGERVAVTAAHCTMEDANFYDFISAYSNYDNLGVANSPGYVSRAIVPVEWYAAAEGGDRDHDFAILVFDSAPVGTTADGLFSPETITVADSIGLSVNCAGWLSDWDDSGGIYAWRNASDGGISLLDDLGNEFHMNLSAWHGMSGGPVHTVRDGEYVAVGIVTHNDTKPPYWNHAMRITEACDCLLAWAEESGFGHLESTGGGTSPSTGPGYGGMTTAQIATQLAVQSTKPEGIPEALEAAMGENSDVFAWLYVPGTRVSTPVARREGDDSYYLNHDASGGSSPAGCAYVGSVSSDDLADAVTAVYGHSFSAGSLALTSLHAFEDYSFFANHGRVYVYLPGKRLSYRVVGAYLFTDKAIGALDQSDPGALADYFASLSDTDPSTYVGFKRGPALDPSSDRVLQLSTCTVPAVECLRFVVTCVYEGEAEV